MMFTRRCLISHLIGLLFLFGGMALDAGAAGKPPVKNVSPGTYPFSITVHGFERSYFVHVPPSYNSAKKWPVLVMFHGGGGTAKTAMQETGWNDKSDKEGFLAVFPEGSPPDPSRPGSFRDNPQTWNDGSKRPSVGAVRRKVPDVEFVSAMLAELKVSFSVDEHRIYATGFSNGASMTFRVARELSPIIAAAAPVAGADWLSGTKQKRAVPLLYITGMADPLNPFEGGEINIGHHHFGRKPAAREMIVKWVKMHDCPNKGRVVYDNGKTTGIAYSLPGESPKVALYTIEGHGHHWPGGKSSLPVRFAGKNTAKIKAADIIWEFFKAHTLADHSNGRQVAPANTDNAGR